MIKYTIVAKEDGREATQYVVRQRPADTLDVEALNTLVAPDPQKEYWDKFREIVYGRLREEIDARTH